MLFMAHKPNMKWSGDPWALDVNVKGVGGQPRPCDWPGCAAEGSHKAPKSRQNLRDNHWFCLEHVRIYNSAWNYYAGMSESEVEADVRRDTVWQRPSWPIGGGKPRVFTFAEIKDSFGFFTDDGTEAERRGAAPMGGPAVKALAVLGLKPPVSVAVVKARYKELAKRYHPDANGGDTASEEKFRDVNLAYKTLMDYLAQ
jgi:hypothetical protein